MNFTKPEPTSHGPSFRRPLNQVKKAAEIVCFPDRANISPYGRSYIRILEALPVEYFTWIFEGDAELRQMPSDIFGDEMGAANVFAWGRSHLPVTPNVVARMPPFVLLSVV